MAKKALLQLLRSLQNYWLWRGGWILWIFRGEVLWFRGRKATGRLNIRANNPFWRVFWTLWACFIETYTHILYVNKIHMKIKFLYICYQICFNRKISFFDHSCVSTKRYADFSYWIVLETHRGHLDAGLWKLMWNLNAWWYLTLFFIYTISWHLSPDKNVLGVYVYVFSPVVVDWTHWSTSMFFFLVVQVSKY